MEKRIIAIEGKRIKLVELDPEKISKEYMKWMEDSEVVQFLECRFQENTLERIKEYVKGIFENENDFLFAIIEKQSEKHIGNVRIGPINKEHQSAEIGIIIGEKNYWGKGFATEAIKLITKYAFEELKLHKLTAGCYEPNIGSAKAFQNAGFKIEGKKENQYFYKGKYVDAFLFGLVNE